MEIPLDAQVECTDGICGRSAYVLINPVGEQVTHLVVREISTNQEYIVPVDLVSDTIADTIQLRCSKTEMEEMDPFIKMTYIEKKVPEQHFYLDGGMNGMGSHYYMPYVTPDLTVKVPMETQQIPPGELAIQRGARVEATDGYIGKVDEFVINPENGRITHLVMREGHLLGQKEVVIPLSAMGEPRNGTVQLKLDKQQTAALPSFPVSRRWP